jgi:hypothetical protein
VNKTLIAGLAGALAVLVVVGAFLALDRTALHWYAGDDGRSSPPYGAVLDCHAPAVNQADMPTMRSIWQPQACAQLPSGIVLECADYKPAEHLRDCGSINIAMTTRSAHHDGADPCAPPTDMPQAERNGWEAFCKANHPPAVTP